MAINKYAVMAWRSRLLAVVKNIGINPWDKINWAPGRITKLIQSESTDARGPHGCPSPTPTAISVATSAEATCRRDAVRGCCDQLAARRRAGKAVRLICFLAVVLAPTGAGAQAWRNAPVRVGGDEYEAAGVYVAMEPPTARELRVVCVDGDPMVQIAFYDPGAVHGDEGIPVTQLIRWPSGARHRLPALVTAIHGHAMVSFSGTSTAELLPLLRGQSSVQTRALDAPGPAWLRWSLAGSDRAIRLLSCVD